MADIRLAKNFLLCEFTASAIADKRGINNVPDGHALHNLRKLAEALQVVRNSLKNPMFISSGYRCDALNKAVGGSATSAHLTGNAADFICPKFGSPKDVIRHILTLSLPFDQLIYEGTWVHFGLFSNSGQQREQVLTYKNGLYIKGLL